MAKPPELATPSCSGQSNRRRSRNQNFRGRKENSSEKTIKRVRAAVIISPCCCSFGDSLENITLSLTESRMRLKTAKKQLLLLPCRCGSRRVDGRGAFAGIVFPLSPSWRVWRFPRLCEFFQITGQMPWQMPPQFYDFEARLNRFFRKLLLCRIPPILPVRGTPKFFRELGQFVLQRGFSVGTLAGLPFEWQYISKTLG